MVMGAPAGYLVNWQAGADDMQGAYADKSIRQGSVANFYVRANF
jgi:hypothetical protein